MFQSSATRFEFEHRTVTAAADSSRTRQSPLPFETRALHAGDVRFGAIHFGRCLQLACLADRHHTTHVLLVDYIVVCCTHTSASRYYGRRLRQGCARVNLYSATASARRRAVLDTVGERWLQTLQ